MTGGLGALFGLYLYVELVQAESVYVRDGLAGLLIGGSLGVFLNAYSPVRDGAWLQLARALAWGVPAAALGGAIGLMAGEVVIGLFRGGLLGRALIVVGTGTGDWTGPGAGRPVARANGVRVDWRRVGRIDRRFLVRVASGRAGGSLRPEPGGGDHDPGCWAGHVLGPGRTGASPGLGSSPQRPPGGAHLSSIPPDVPPGSRRTSRDRHLR